MHIVLNGEQTEIPSGSTAADLIERLGIGGRRIAMELNHEIVPRSTYGDTILQEGDKVEVVHAIGGGTLPPTV